MKSDGEPDSILAALSHSTCAFDLARTSDFASQETLYIDVFYKITRLLLHPFRSFFESRNVEDPLSQVDRPREEGPSRNKAADRLFQRSLQPLRSLHYNPAVSPCNLHNRWQPHQRVLFAWVALL